MKSAPLPDWLQDLAQRHPLCHIRFNHNQRTLISIRPRKPAALTLSLHADFAHLPHLAAEFDLLIRRRGRGSFPQIRQAMQRIFEHIQERLSTQQAPLYPSHEAMVNERRISVEDQRIYAMAGHGRTLCLDQRLDAIQAQYWPQLPRPLIKWGRNPGMGPLRSIRFGSYRSRPQPLITIHPRLALPWVSLLFVDHVIHHELCHHGQWCQPLVGERTHSPRFRSWEGQFVNYAQARHWERLALKVLLRPAGLAHCNELSLPWTLGEVVTGYRTTG